MFQKNVFGTSRTRASAAALLVTLICSSAGSGEGGGKGKQWLSSPFILSLSLVDQTTHRIYARGKRGPERMGSPWRKAGVLHPEFIGTTRGGRLGGQGSWVCVSVSVSRECVGN